MNLYIIIFIVLDSGSKEQNILDQAATFPRV
jgi:hypothetical protein